MSIDQPLEALNERELEIIPLLEEGLSNKEIADRLFLAPSTVKWYVRQLNSKLDTSGRDEIVKRAAELGLAQVEKPENSYLRPRTNLPHQTTPFIGRDAELDEIHHILENPDVRLLTILAPGGMGKTRIALEAAEQQANNFPDGVYFVPLQSLSEIDQIMPQIASAVGYQFANDGRDVTEQVLDFLSNKAMFLCVDNCEHLLDGAVLLNEILQAAPDLKILVTSREKLNLMGETVYYLQGMQFPAWEIPEDALRYDAVELLVQAARRVKPDWKITKENLNHVTRVCRLTQGMPLGILLAASWLDLYSLERICEEIQKNVDILESDMRDIPERQRSIRAVFNHAWHSMSPQERDAFMRMSIFKGGCTAHAADVITGASPRILHKLVNKALLARTKDGRYDVHELLRQYAEKELIASGEADSTLRAHNGYYADVVNESWEAIISGRGEFFAVMKGIESDIRNIELAWHKSIENAQFQDVSKLIRLLVRYYYNKQESNTSHSMMKVAYDRYQANPSDIPATLQVRIQIGYDHATGFTIFDDEDRDRKLAVCRQAERVFREHDEKEGILLSLILQAVLLNFNHKDTNESVRILEEGVRIAREIDSPFYEVWCLNILGLMWYELQHLNKAKTLYQQGLALANKTNQQYWALLLMRNLALNLAYEGDHDASEKLLVEVLRSGRIANSQEHINGSLTNLLRFMSNWGRFDEAEHYLQQIEHVANQLGGTINHLWYLREKAYKHYMTGDYETSLQILNEIEDLIGEDYTLGAAWNMVWKGLALCALEQYDEAQAVLINGLRLFQSRSTRILSLPILGFSLVLAYQYQQYERAVELASLSQVLNPLEINWDVQPVMLKFRAFLDTVLKQDEFDNAWQRGQSLDVNGVVQALLDEFS